MKFTGMTHSTPKLTAISLRPFLSCLNVMLGAEWIIRLIYVAGTLCFVSALLFVESETAKANVLLASAIFLVATLTLNAASRFRYFVSSTRFSLAPNNRLIALFSLITCILIATILAGATAYFLGKNVIQIVAICALSFSAGSLYIQYAVTGMKTLVLSALCLGLSAVLVKRLFAPFPPLDTPMVLSVLAGMTVLLWTSVFVWLRQAKAISPISHMFTDAQNCNQDQAWLMNLWSANAEDMGKRALMHGMADSLARRFTLHAVLLFGFPIMMLLMQIILASGSSRFVEKPLLLLFLSAYTLMMTPLINGDWLTRTRLLWLRLPGDRAALFRFWAKSLLIDKAVGLLLLLCYVLILFIAFDLPLFVTALFVLSYIILDILIVLTWSYLRISGRSQSTITALNFGTSMPLIATLFLLGKFDLWIWFGAMIAAVILCAIWVTSLLRRCFYQMDWSAVKPLRYGKKG